MRTVTRGSVAWNVEESAAGDSFWTQWEAGEWEQETLDTIDTYVKPGSTFVDIGAWIGPVTLWAARIGVHVVAVEPDRIALGYLFRNVELNANDVMIIEGAVADHTGTCRIVPQNDYGWGASMTHLSDEGEEVRCWTLPDLFAELSLENVSLVKMDIEGAEALILEEVAPFLSARGIPLYLEMHHELGAVVDRLPDWFAGFSRIEGGFASFGHLLAIP